VRIRANAVLPLSAISERVLVVLRASGMRHRI